eukprot:CAMPEP_0197672306 /NCGR_PEP_ID=MMETSP1338-20131121/78643_1 /TAXON_ID=43686 ORGANISM="Pelagodinium beii, Strain RCC1491" /NCGR_SAMPLE_ID=MMETSP1338 /ASSEMBLY_ACC=CAM_ASM_000754 /LENGTH=70 /DNA_ID=CAMNT_0043252383 /DNA_START=27 /DNA_END=240 /DNA_ORIENTATION=-
MIPLAAAAQEGLAAESAQHVQLVDVVEGRRSLPLKTAKLTIAHELKGIILVLCLGVIVLVSHILRSLQLS